MKLRFNNYDIVCGVAELQKLIGLRVNQIYDIDRKTYLIRLHGKNDEKHVLLFESGTRFHTTAYEWTKNPMPSGFTMKLRKHLKNKRLESVCQLGGDRIVKFQFGTSLAAYHVILELYDRGNIVLTDHEYTMLYVLRPHTEGESISIATHQKYPMERIEQVKIMDKETLTAILENAKHGDDLKYLLVPKTTCGPTVLEHVLLKHKLLTCYINKPSTEEAEPEKVGKKAAKKKKISGMPFNMESDLDTLLLAVKEAEDILEQGAKCVSKGYIIQKPEDKPAADGAAAEVFYRNVEYQPTLFLQYEARPSVAYDTFMTAVDQYYSTLESQKIDMKTLQQEREAFKKLSNVKKDHERRLENLSKVQEEDNQKAELITRNQALVDACIMAMRSTIASQISWSDIGNLLKEAQANGDFVANTIKKLKFESNKVSLYLTDPYAENSDDFNIDSDDEEEKEEDKKNDSIPPMLVDVDLGLSAFANARTYYQQKRYAAKKEQKTVDASQKALKSAERKTQQTLKSVRTISTITKARKVYWFEKFFWFISSENYLVIGGRDAQQNELIVKRYMRPCDIYVHAEVQGASSIVIRNPSNAPIPPKTLSEAGTMAICYSVAWDAKIVTNAYWVHSDQVSKTAPSGEYLTTGSFMIRGKKNPIPPCLLTIGVSVLFKLEESFVDKHRGERKVRDAEDAEELHTNAPEQFVDIQEEEDEDEVAEKPANTAESEEEDKANDELQFPDTQVRVEHERSTANLPTQLASALIIKNENSNSFFSKEKLLAGIPEETFVTSVPTKVKTQQKAAKRKEKKEKGKKEEKSRRKHQGLPDEDEDDSFEVKSTAQQKKSKKLKQKYKNQDEEEKQLRLQILKPAVVKEVEKPETPEEDMQKTKTQMQNKEKAEKNKDAQNVAEDAEDLPVGEELDMIDTLTGRPDKEDELLFAVPVIAPYQALQSYKFKIKITPGTTKRGRAAKTALMMFSKDKECTGREKDLIKSLNEEHIARNMPGKVKLSAPQLQKFKK